MATYVTLFKFSLQGLQKAKDMRGRLDQSRTAMEGAGARLTHFYWTQGQYDAIAISEWDDQESAMASWIQLGALGNIESSETLSAFDEVAIDRIIAKLPWLLSAASSAPQAGRW